MANATLTDRRAWLQPVRVEYPSGCVFPLAPGIVQPLQAPAILAYEAAYLLLILEHGERGNALTDMLSHGGYAWITLQQEREVTEALLVLRSVRVAIRNPEPLRWDCEDQFRFAAVEDAADRWLAGSLREPARYPLEVTGDREMETRQFFAEMLRLER